MFLACCTYLTAFDLIAAAFIFNWMLADQHTMTVVYRDSILPCANCCIRSWQREELKGLTMATQWNPACSDFTQPGSIMPAISCLHLLSHDVPA